MRIGLFKPLSPGDHPRYKGFFDGQPYPLCVYSLAAIIVWSNRVYRPYAAVVEDEALAVGVEYSAVHENQRHLILPVSPTRSFPPEELAEIARRLGFGAFWFVPDPYLDQWGRDRVERSFTVTGQPHLEDYVYRTVDLAELKGNRYARKRNLVNQFRSAYVHRGRVEVERITPENALECVDFLEEWCRRRECDTSPEEDLSCEKQAVINSLEHIEILELLGLLLRIDERVCAIGIGSRLTRDMAALHFEKAFPEIKGLYQFFDAECARILFSGIPFLNKESDLELPRLAKSKASYHPVARIASHRLTLPEADPYS